MGRLADERGAAPGHAIGREHGDRKTPARARFADAPKQAAETLFERGGEGVGVERHQRVDLSVRGEPDQARSVGVGEGDRGHRGPLAVQLDRNAAVREAMSEARGDGAFAVTPLGAADAGRLAADRVAAIGADDELGGEGEAILGAQPGVVRRPHDAIDRHRMMGNGFGARAPVQRLNEDAVGDVVTEGLEPELACPELDVRRPEQSAGIVDDADGK